MPEFYLYKGKTYCDKCAVKLVKSGIIPEDAELGILSKDVEGVVCVECKEDVGDKALFVRMKPGSGAAVVGGRVLCPACAKKAKKLAKAEWMAEITEEDVFNAPLYCDNCDAPISVSLSGEAIACLRKTVEALEEVLQSEQIKTVRPALWDKANLVYQKLKEIAPAD